MILSLTLLWYSTSNAQAFPPGSKAEWDYFITDYQFNQINRFEVTLDAVLRHSGPVDVNRATENLNTYQWPLPTDLKPGTHRIEVRACNIGGCSPPLALDFGILGTAPSPSNLRIVQPL